MDVARMNAVTCAPVIATAYSAVEEEQTMLLFFELCDALRLRHGYTEPQATEVARLCIDTMAAVGDDELLAAKRLANRMARQRRDAAIRAELRTGNAAELGRRYGLTARQVYRIAGANAAATL
jgi:hypothetical protein